MIPGSSPARRCGRVGLALALGLLAMYPIAAHAQSWTYDPATTSINLFTQATTVCATACGPIIGPTVLLAPGLQGEDMTWFSEAMCKMAATAPCGCKARAWARVGVRGLGGPSLRIRCEGYSYVKHRCNYPIAYFAEGIGDIDPSVLGLTIVGGIAPYTINYRGNGFSFASHDPEAGGDDWTVVGLPATSLTINGTPVLVTGALDLPFVRGSLRDNWLGAVTSGPAVGVGIAGGTWAVIHNPAKSTGGGPWHQYYEWDSEFAGFVYNLTMNINGSVPPDTCPDSPTIEFSLDIGSDSERSDPLITGNEVFEPFDTYLAGGPAIPFPGADGVRTDDAALGIDMPPVVPGGPGAPSCSGGPIGPATTGFLDLDGTDSLDFSLTAIMAASPQTPLGALLFPIPAFPSSCVHRVENLIISYEDDTAEHFVGDPAGMNPCPVPVGSGSPLNQTYGSALMRDEVMGLSVFTTPTGTGGVVYPLRDEAGLHVSLAPDPPPTPPFSGPLPPQAADDDVDALDVVATSGACSTWLFGVDHEARAGFPVPAPGNIYEWSPGGLLLNPINCATHLGLPASTDLRDFELVRMDDPTGVPTEVFALLFAVAPDDPLTAGDESGGLNPAMIYYSYFTGVSFALLEFPLEDAIDGIAAWCEPLADAAPCPADINGDGVVNVNDLLAIINAWGAPGGPADINGDGIVDVNDLLIIINAWGPCL